MCACACVRVCLSGTQVFMHKYAHGYGGQRLMAGVFLMAHHLIFLGQSLSQKLECAGWPAGPSDCPVCRPSTVLTGTRLIHRWWGPISDPHACTSTWGTEPSPEPPSCESHTSVCSVKIYTGNIRMPVIGPLLWREGRKDRELKASPDDITIWCYKLQ